MGHYSLAVALFDFLPVVLSGLAMACLAAAIRRQQPMLGRIALGAALLIPFGGICKASWKLIIALGGDPLPWLENLLFICLAPGFVAMAFCLYHARQAWRGAAPSPGMRMRLSLYVCAPLLLGLVLALALPGSRAWFFALLAVTTLASAALIVHAIMAARDGRLGVAVSAGFAFNFAATLVLAGLSRLPPGEASAWLQEGVNLSAQAALLAASRPLGRRMQESL